MNVLVTGGAGYIGSHICLSLLQANHDVVVFDNLSTSTALAIERITGLTGRQLPLIIGDIRNKAALQRLFAQHRIDAVIHCAGLKSVAESVINPAHYHDNNVTGSALLLETMADHQVQRLIFSSSACVYADDGNPPFSENATLKPNNPYGESKLAVEQLLDIHAARHPYFQAIALRYYNPVGAHDSGEIGECPRGAPNNLMPILCKVAIGDYPALQIFGDDYPTPDGTAVRDYIHVMDVAESHVRALDMLGDVKGAAWRINIGRGTGCSVLELVQAFEAANNLIIPLQMAPRRPGDAAQSFADTRLAEQRLHWKAERNLTTMCRDAWRWQMRYGPAR